MKRNFQVVKNLILVVASALTIIAATFAWFSVSNSGEVPALTKKVGGNLISVQFQNSDLNGGYELLDGDIDLAGCTAGEYKQYRMIVTANTAEKLKLKFSIDDLPSAMPADLKNSVQIKYVLKKATKSKDVNGKTVYTDGNIVSQSSGYVPLSNLTDGVIFNDLSLAAYQNVYGDSFLIYYEIGLDPDSPTTIQNLSADLGDVNITAQLVG